jgi:hypothetical protein
MAKISPQTALDRGPTGSFSMTDRPDLLFRRRKSRSAADQATDDAGRADFEGYGSLPVRPFDAERPIFVLQVEALEWSSCLLLESAYEIILFDGTHSPVLR